MSAEEHGVAGLHAPDAERAGRYRVFAALAGSYLVRDQAARAHVVHPMVTRALSADAIVVDANTRPTAGAAVALNIVGMGLLEGRTAALTPSGFTIEPLFASPEALADFGRRLDWLRKVSLRQARDHRGDERHRVPARPVSWRLGNADGGEGMVYDVSRSGMAILTSVPPETGAEVVVGSVAARVVRQLPMGFAVQFATPFETVAETLAHFSER